MTTINESRTAKGFTPASLVPAAFGRKRTIDGIVIHHWGTLGQQHQDVVNFFVDGPGSTSAHFVVSAGRIDCLVSPADAAWHSGNAVGNATTIGIECRPEATDADYATVAELVRYLREQYGTLPLSPHRQWNATACPGVWDLDRIDRLAGSAAINPQSTTTVQEDDMAAVPQEEWEGVKASIKALVDNVATKTDLSDQAKLTPGEVWAYRNPNIGGGDAFQILRDALAGTNKLADVVAGLAARAASGGASQEQIKQAVLDGLKQGVTVTVGGAK